MELRAAKPLEALGQSPEVSVRAGVEREIGGCQSKRMSTDELCRSIEQLVQQHLRACQREVAAVVERTFRTAAVTATEPKSKAKAAKPKRENGARRTPAQIHALGERSLCANKFETTAQLNLL